jgi:putative ABC transport system permease protein
MLSDFRYAVRMLLKSPGFAVIAVLTLALGIGANSAIFSVIDRVLLRPLPFPNPGQLVAVWSRVQGESDRETGSYPDFADIRDQTPALEGLFAYTLAATVLGTGSEAHELAGLAVTSDIFSVLGVAPLLGRTFTRDEETKDSRVIVLTYEAWQRYWSGDRSILGRDIICSLKPYTVIGIMPPRYAYPVGRRCDYFMPLQALVAAADKNRGAHFLRLVGRLRSSANVRQAAAEAAAVGARMEKEYPDTNTGRSYFVVSLHRDVVGDVRSALLTLVAAVFFVLLIACANVANLLLARATQRRREIAIRTALGASRVRIVRQMLAEGFLLAFVGAGGGLLLAWWGIDLVRLFGPQDVPRLDQIGIDGAVVAFSLVTAVFSTFLFAIAPALQITGRNMNASLQEGGRGAIGPESHRLRATLVIGQVALSMLLLAGSALLIKSFSNLRGTNPGFDPSRVVTMDLPLPRATYSDEQRQTAFFAALDVKLRALPGIETAGGAMPLPFTGNDRASSFWITGRPDPGLGNHPNASHLTILGDYFRTMHIALRAGRTFRPDDKKGAASVVMVNEAFVRKFFEGRNAVGEHILIDHDESEKSVPLEIIGVVASTRHESLAIDPIPEFYVPFAQEPDRRMDLVLRTSNQTLTGLQTSVARAVHEMDRDVYVPQLQPLEKLIGGTLAQPRFNMILLGTFAGVAMVLAAIGLYGVMAYNVAQRTREIGIRMALGAQKGDMLRLILRQALAIVAIGLAIGLLSSLGATRLMASLLYGVGIADFTVYGAVIVLLGGAAVLASYLPARRAMAVDPIVALRYE